MGFRFVTAAATYTGDEVALLAQVSKKQIYRVARRDEIPGRVKGLGRLLRFNKRAVDNWLLGQAQAAAG